MVEIIENPQDLEDLACEWNSLAEPFKTPLLRHEWFYCCAKSFYSSKELCVFLIRSGGRITAIAPLVATRSGLAQRLQLLGSSYLFEQSGFLYKDWASLRALIQEIIQNKKALILEKIAADSLIPKILPQVCQKRALLSVRKSNGSPWLPMKGSWLEFEAGLSARRRSDFRRALRRAKRHGEVAFEILSPTPDTVDAYLIEIFAVEKASWKGEQGFDMSSHPGFKAFFTSYCREAARLRILRLCFFRVHGKAIAFQLAAEFANRFWVFKIGFDTAWSRCSPGMVLMHETIRQAFEKGLEAYEFLGSDEPWIRVWTDHVHPQVTFRIYPYSTNGLLRSGVDVYGYLFKKSIL